MMEMPLEIVKAFAETLFVEKEKGNFSLRCADLGSVDGYFQERENNWYFYHDWQSLIQSEIDQADAGLTEKECDPPPDTSALRQVHRFSLHVPKSFLHEIVPFFSIPFYYPLCSITDSRIQSSLLRIASARYSGYCYCFTDVSLFCNTIRQYPRSTQAEAAYCMGVGSHPCLSYNHSAAQQIPRPPPVPDTGRYVSENPRNV